MGYREQKEKNRKLVIIGAGGHGKVIADIAVQNGYRNIVFLDDNEKITECAGYPVAGKCMDAEKFDADIVLGIGNASIRKKLSETLNNMKNVNLVTLVHPDAVVAQDVVLGVGSVVMAGAVINPGVIIGKGCIINTCSSVDHDCRIGDFVHIAVGSHLCGMVVVEDEVWIGAGATVSNNIVICGGCMIGAGAVVVKDIKRTGTYIGVPAKEIGVVQKILIGGGGENLSALRWKRVLPFLVWHREEVWVF